MEANMGSLSSLITAVNHYVTVKRNCTIAKVILCPKHHFMQGGCIRLFRKICKMVSQVNYG